MNINDIQHACGPLGLDVYGCFHPVANDFSGAKTLVLLGPSTEFWHIFQKSNFAHDAQPDPIDRWSTATIKPLADALNARAIFPFGPAPYAPFISWAQNSGRAWSSPVGMLVHDKTGLMVSYRGALAFDTVLDPPPTPPKPCDTCKTQPCITACPVDALSDGYNVDACQSFLATDAGKDCMTHGCRVRRLCPISIGAGRTSAQSALHMQAFKKE